MAKLTDKTNTSARSKKDRAWFRRKIAELKTELAKLPADRREQLRRELEGEREQ